MTEKSNTREMALIDNLTKIRKDAFNIDTKALENAVPFTAFDSTTLAGITDADTSYSSNERSAINELKALVIALVADANAKSTAVTALQTTLTKLINNGKGS